MIEFAFWVALCGWWISLAIALFFIRKVARLERTIERLTTPVSALSASRLGAGVKKA